MLSGTPVPEGLPQAFFDGDGDRALFGWLHRPAAGSSAGVGVVICSSFGREEMCAHRSLRALAQALAGAGVPALRFDYPGSGDAGGRDDEGNLLDSWVEAVNRAGDLLRRACGVQQLVFVGMRLGATLAARAVAARSDVAGFVALVPVLKGRAFVRELTVLHNSWAAAFGQEPTALEGLLQSGGFVMTLATRDALSTLDLAATGAAPARHILLIDRDDLPGNDKLADAWRAGGADVNHLALPGYTGMVDHPHHAVVPQAMVDAIVGWVAARSAALLQHGAGADPNAASPTTSVAPGVIEEALYLPGTALFGVLTRPAGAAHGSGQAAGAVRAVLMLNAGSIRHIGVGRLSVALARRWAAEGWTVLRMDISGIGDSPARPGEPENDGYTACAQDDLARAVHYLREAFGATTVYGLGLCSGAYHLFKAAAAGVPLNGALTVNPLVYFWQPGMSLDAPTLAPHEIAGEAARYREAMWSREKWLKMVRGEVKLQTLLSVMVQNQWRRQAPRVRALARLLGRPMPLDLAAELQRVARHGVPLRFVFSLGDPGLDVLLNDGAGVLRRLQARGLISVQTIEGADHIFTDCMRRRQLADLLTVELHTLAARPH